ncbi:MAG: cytochrome P460 family protein [Acidobacteria bacterium]|nr:cytochrome P460 family protein [Acidobacteriota bacterium]MBI3426585.1 cytochrome P460 family protein [Acidobacteriota bacterium]
MRTKMLLSGLAFVLALTLSTGGMSLFTGALPLEQKEADGPQYTTDNQLLRPANYRAWVYLSSSVGLQYGPNAPANPAFENVYVNPAAYKEFAKTGQWPDKTIFVLEIRRLLDKGTFAHGGQYQGDLITLEAAVKDERRFPEKWAYFGLGATAPSAKAIPKEGGCFSCHSQNAAVENTFAQFYPTVLAIAKEKGTLNQSYQRTQQTQ